MLTGKVLHRSVFHIQTIVSALQLAGGNPKGLFFKVVGNNMFVAKLVVGYDLEYSTKCERQ